MTRPAPAPRNRNAPPPKNYESDIPAGPAEGDTTPRCGRGHGLIRWPGQCKHCDRWSKERHP